MQHYYHDLKQLNWIPHHYLRSQHLFLLLPIWLHIPWCLVAVSRSQFIAVGLGHEARFKYFSVLLESPWRLFLASETGRTHIRFCPYRAHLKCSLATSPVGRQPLQNICRLPLQSRKWKVKCRQSSDTLHWSGHQRLSIHGYFPGKSITQVSLPSSNVLCTFWRDLVFPILSVISFPIPSLKEAFLYLPVSSWTHAHFPSQFLFTPVCKSSSELPFAFCIFFSREWLHPVSC